MRDDVELTMQLGTWYTTCSTCSILINERRGGLEKWRSMEVFYDKSFGVHKPWMYLDENNYKMKVNSCDGLDKLKELNS